jgi:hypothetical protein
MKKARRSTLKVVAPFGVGLVAFATACGFLASPGEYASGGDDGVDASVETSSPPTDATTNPEVIALPDGNVVPAPIGTIALMAGERQPLSPEDDPAWSADAWSGIVGADGHVTSWRIEKSAPLVGSFEAAGLVGNTWVMINFGFGLNGGRGTAIQSTSWAPGIVGDWKAGRANGAPAGLDETMRAFFGNHLLYVGGSRTTPGVDGGPATTALADEVHVADVDAAMNTLGGAADSGRQLTTARARPGVIVSGGSVYVVGGRSASGISAAVETAKVDGAAGTVQPFADQPPLMNGTTAHKVFLPNLAVAEGYLFVAGGRISFANAPTDIVLSAKINADGTLGAFQTVSALPKALRDFALVGFKGKLYVAGGIATAGRSDEVFSATVGADGKLSAWDNTNAKLPSARSDFVALAY